MISEPSGVDIFIAEKGALWLRVTTRGKTAHTSMPHLGENAISKMVNFLHKVDNPLKAMSGEHPLLGRATLNIGRIYGGVTINVAPDKCSVEMDFRLLPGQNHEEVIAELQEIGGEDISIEIIDWKESVESDPGEEIVKIALHAVEAVTGEEQKAKGVSYYTDGAILANRINIPMVNIGPASIEMTHQTNEYVPIEMLVQAEKNIFLIALRSFICFYCGLIRVWNTSHCELLPLSLRLEVGASWSI